MKGRGVLNWWFLYFYYKTNSKKKVSEIKGREVENCDFFGLIDLEWPFWNNFKGKKSMKEWRDATFICSGEENS